MIVQADDKQLWAGTYDIMYVHLPKDDTGSWESSSDAFCSTGISSAWEFIANSDFASSNIGSFLALTAQCID